MRVLVRYLVPVVVEVDIVSGHVVRVQVDDEAVGEAEDVFLVDGSPLADVEWQSAVTVAGEEPWPAWEFGLG